MCVTWVRTNGRVNRGVCNEFADIVQSFAEAQGFDKQSMAKAFSCKEVNSTMIRPVVLPFVVVCGDFKTEADAKTFGEYLRDGGMENDLGKRIGFDNQLVPIFGNMVCLPSELRFVITDMSGQECDSFTHIKACAVEQDQFPYCECKPGAMLSTPYNVTYSRKFSKGGNNHYCFKVNVDKGKCSSRCCNMELEKIEWMSDQTNCRYAVAGWTVSTKPNAFISPVWDMKPDTLLDAPNTVTVAVLKTNNLALNTNNANGVEVCIALKGDGKCPTMEQFCYGGICKYAVFDLPLGCCAKDFAEGDFGYNRRR